MKCTKCQAEIPEGAKFCVACGAPADQDNQPEAAGAGNGAAAGNEGAEAAEPVEAAAPAEAAEPAEAAVPAEAAEPAEAAAPAEAAVPAEAAEPAEAAAPAPAEAAVPAEAAAPAAAAAPAPSAASAPVETPASAAAPAETPPPAPQPAYSAAAPAGPSDGGGKGGGKNFVKVIIAVIAAIAVISVAALATIKLTSKSPKDVVIAAFENVHPKGEVYPSEELFGTSEFIKNAQKASAEGGLTLKLSDCSDPSISQYKGSGLRIEGKDNVDTKESSANMGLIYNGMDLLTLDAYYGNKKMAVAIPELSSKVFTLDLNKDLAQQVKDSPVFGELAEESGIDADDIAAYLNELQTQIEASQGQQPFDLTALMNRYKEGCKAQANFKAALTVTKGDKKKFTMDGKEVSCRGYKTHISKDSMIDFLNSSSDFFLQDEQFRQDFLNQLKLSVRMSELMGGSMSGMSAEDLTKQTYDEAEKSVEEMITYLDDSLNDVDMTVYVDKKGRLAAVEGTTVIHTDDDDLDVNFNIELKGGVYLTQNFDGTVEVTDGTDTVTATMHREGTYDGNELTDGANIEVKVTGEGKSGFSYNTDYTKDSGDYQIGFKVYGDGTDIADISMKGTVDELEKGKTIHTDIDELKIALMDESEYVSLEGEYYYRPLEDGITAPQGDPMDIMTATYDDWNDVATELYGNVFGLLMQLQ